MRSSPPQGDVRERADEVGVAGQRQPARRGRREPGARACGAARSEVAQQQEEQEEREEQLEERHRRRRAADELIKND